jgi:hypothetical protein
MYILFVLDLGLLGPPAIGSSMYTQRLRDEATRRRRRELRRLFIPRYQSTEFKKKKRATVLLVVVGKPKHLTRLLIFPQAELEISPGSAEPSPI